jgi:hypothetical protein
LQCVRRVFWKLFGLASVATGVLALMLAAFAAERVVSEQSRQRDHQLETTARILGTLLRDVPEQDWQAAAPLASQLRQLAEAASVSITLIEPDGQIWADSHQPSRDWKNQRNRPELQQVLRNRQFGEDIRASETDSRLMRVPSLAAEG